MERALPVLHYRFHNVRFPCTKYTYLYKPINVIYLYKPGVKIFFQSDIFIVDSFFKCHPPWLGGEENFGFCLL